MSGKENRIVESFKTSWLSFVGSLKRKHPDSSGDSNNGHFVWTIITTSADNKKYLGLFLKLNPDQGESQATFDKAKNLLASFTAKLIDPKSNEPIQVAIGEKHDLKKFCAGIGWKNFIDIKKLDIYKFEDGMLKLQLTFTLHTDTEEPKSKRHKELMEQSLPECREQILESVRSRHNSDVLLKTTDDKGLDANRFVLTCRSKYFETQLKDVPNPTYVNGQLLLPVPHSLNIMKVVLCHIYTGWLSLDLVNKDITNAETAKALADAASMYGLKYMETFLMECHPDLKKVT